MTLEATVRPKPNSEYRQRYRFHVYAYVLMKQLRPSAAGYSTHSSEQASKKSAVGSIATLRSSAALPWKSYGIQYPVAAVPALRDGHQLVSADTCQV
jgi:hypothetical protein